jgi:hypothetical protein
MTPRAAVHHQTPVLVTDGGVGQARSTLATVRALAQGGYRPAVTVSGPFSLAAASRHCDHAVPVPQVGSEGFAEEVRSELASGGYLTVLAAGDAALLALGARVEHLVDKSLLPEAAERVGIGSPPLEVFASAEELMRSAQRLRYPIV